MSEHGDDKKKDVYLPADKKFLLFSMVHVSFGRLGYLELFTPGCLKAEQVPNLPEVRAFAADHPEARRAKCDVYRYFLRGEGEDRDATPEEIEKIVDDSFPDHPLDLVEMNRDEGEPSESFEIIIPDPVPQPEDVISYTIYR